MGKKSEKKVKSDRINALRKQYDAFLEEDKKRKERNKYILGKLDNIRYSSTAVQLHHKPVVYEELYPPYSRVAYRQEHFEQRDVHITPTQQITRPTHNNLQLDVPRKYLDDTSLLKEISKKYILIPKLRPSLMNDYVETIPPHPFPPVNKSYELPTTKTNIINNDDWRSKYDILEKLKTEETNNCGKDELFPVKGKQALRNNESNKDNKGFDLQTNKTDEFAAKYEHEIPEKDLSFEKAIVENETQKLEKSIITEDKDQKPSTDHAQSISTASHMNNEINTTSDLSLHNQRLEYNKENVLNASSIVENLQQSTPTENHMTPECRTEEVKNTENEQQMFKYLEQKEYLQQQQYPKQEEYLQQEEYPQQEEYLEQQEYPKQEEDPVEYEQPIVSEGIYPDPKNVYLDENDYSPIQVVNPSELVKEEHTANETKEGGEEYPAELLNVQEFTPNDDVQLQDGVNINPTFKTNEENVDLASYDNTSELQATAKHTEDVPDKSGIEAFDAEQREMFYSEETDEYAYDQQVEGNVYNQEYDQNETYPPNQENSAYYEGAEGMQEQAYPVEINEHEETSSRYDQNYEQQYTTQYEEPTYEQVQQQQEYHEPIENYDQTEPQYQQYEYEQPDPETAQGVEQTLDNEQGFYEKQNVEALEQNEEAIAEEKAEEKVS